ncbi:MAG: sigma-54-dependent Fis family transcriptional regulator [Planctomycetes bacterium]|nr:sigma-54-dependent Fis family transcriptional regulator [Planctomycetota bacterium]
MSGERVLIVDDDQLIRWSLSQRLGKEGFQTFEAPDGAAAEALLAEQSFDLILLDYKLPDTDGIAMLKKLEQSRPDALVILMTAFSSIEKVVEAMKLGAYDYIHKPFDMDEMVVTIRKALETTRLRREVKTLLTDQRSRFGFDKIVGVSPKMREVFQLLKRVAESETTTVLLQGESGVGKSLVARAIHFNSSRATAPFMTIACTAIPEALLESELMGHERGAFTDAKAQKKGLLELADTGTLFLDEIGETPASFQVKLLSFLEERTFRRVGGTMDINVNVRVIAATNQDLEKAVQDGRFRSDLYYRLKVVPIVLPALRERREDIGALVRYYVDYFNREFRKSIKDVSAEAMKLLEEYAWPGNIRELKNVVERAMILSRSDEFVVEDLPPEIRRPSLAAPASGFRFRLPEEGINLEELELDCLKQALDLAKGNQSKAARLLGMNRDQIRYRMEKYSLKPTS